jgi:hypothetical protein
VARTRRRRVAMARRRRVARTRRRRVGWLEAADAAAPPCVRRGEGVGEDEPDGRIRLCGPR